MSKNEFSESSCNGSEFPSDPELCLNEEFSLFEEFSRLTSENSQGTFREFEESNCDTEESNRSRSIYLLTKNSLCVVIFQNLLHSILSP